MSSALLHIHLGSQDAHSDSGWGSPCTANDNTDREQELFERSASRESAGEDD